jgi:hypothetical protein
MIEGFLLGVIVCASLASAGFFLKFWKQTGDPLFLSFGAAFLIEGGNRIFFLFLDAPDEGHPFLFAIRLVSYLLILAAIAQKNRR